MFLQEYMLVGGFLAGHAFAMLALAWYAVVSRNYCIVDAGWTLGMLLGAAWLLETGSSRSLALTMLVMFWGARLSLHLIRDRVLSPHEDKRYLALEQWLGGRRVPGFVVLFLLQTVFVGLFLLPWFAAVKARPDWALPDIVGFAIAVGAIGGERLADRQLAAFRSVPENEGKVMQTGLWRFSRHPNYFFEWLHWSAYAWFTFGSPLWFIGLAAPLMMYGFLLYGTGVPHLEREAVRSRGVQYLQYQQTTNRFWPWKPRKLHTRSV